MKNTIAYSIIAMTMTITCSCRETNKEAKKLNKDLQQAKEMEGVGESKEEGMERALEWKDNGSGNTAKEVSPLNSKATDSLTEAENDSL